MRSVEFDRCDGSGCVQPPVQAVAVLLVQALLWQWVVWVLQVSQGLLLPQRRWGRWLPRMTLQVVSALEP